MVDWVIGRGRCLCESVRSLLHFAQSGCETGVRPSFGYISMALPELRLLRKETLGWVVGLGNFLGHKMFLALDHASFSMCIIFL